MVDNTETILDFLSERHRKLGKNARNFFAVSLLVSLCATLYSILTGSYIIPVANNTMASGFQSLQFSISYSASVLSQISMWFFSIIALLFPTYISFVAYVGTSISESPLRTRSHRWLSLGASTLAPIVMFAFAWVQLPNIDYDNINTSDNVGLFATIIIIGGLIVAIGFKLVDKIPREKLPIKFALYSSILYITLIISFGIEQSILILCTLLGILFYIMWDSDKIPELMSEIALFDLDKNVSDRVRELLMQDDRLTLSRIEASIRKERLETKEKEMIQDRVESDINREEGRRNALETIEQARQEQIEKIDQAINKQQDTRIKTTAAALDIIMEQYERALIDRQQAQLDSIKDGSASLNAEELEKQLSEVMKGLSGTGIPEIAAEMKKNIQSAYDEQVKRLSVEDNIIRKQKFDDLDEGEREEITKTLKEITGITNKIKYLKKIGLDIDDAKILYKRFVGNYSDFTFDTTWQKN